MKGSGVSAKIYKLTKSCQKTVAIKYQLQDSKIKLQEMIESIKAQQQKRKELFEKFKEMVKAAGEKNADK